MTRQAEDDAAALLEAEWTLGREQPPLPVDPFAIAGQLGIVVYSARLTDGVSGYLSKKAGSPPEIYLNNSDHRHRRRFTAAHELGHFYRRREANELAFLDRRDEVAKQGTDPEEVYANSFASALLMPRQQFLEVRAFDTMALARMFEVSEEAVLIRLRTVSS